MAKRKHVRGRRVKITGGDAPAVLSEAQVPTMKAPTPDQVTKIAQKLDLNDTKRKLVTDESKETIARAKETQHLDPLAMSIARRLGRLEDEKLAVTLPHLLRYIEDLGLSKRATAQGEMFVPEPDELAGQTDLEQAIAAQDNTGVTDGAPPSARLRIIDETGERDIA